MSADKPATTQKLNSPGLPHHLYFPFCLLGTRQEDLSFCLKKSKEHILFFFSIVGTKLRII